MDDQIYQVNVSPDEDAPAPTESSFNKKSRWKDYLSTAAVLIAAPIIALCLTAFVFQSYQVDGPSMETTLQNHDRLIVDKIPRTWAKITGHTFIPNRGDIIIFNLNDSASLNSGGSRQLVKRVIALPGERVTVKDGVITVYNTAHPDGFDPDKTLPYGKVIGVTDGSIDLVVPDGHVFVCGDNRGNSLDSRSFGPVDSKDIIGKLVYRLFPLNKAEKF